MAGYEASVLHPSGQSGVAAPTTRGTFKSVALVMPAVLASTSGIAVVVVAPLEPPPTAVPEPVAPVAAVSPLDPFATLPLLVVPLSEMLPEDEPLAGGTFVEAPLGDEAPDALEPEPFAPTAPFEDAVGSALLHALARQTALINVKALVRRIFRPAIAHRTSATIRYTLKTLSCARKPSYAKNMGDSAQAEYSVHCIDSR
jgi:hypothetical protein